MIAGSITDVTAVVQSKAERIKKQRQNGGGDEHCGTLQTVQQHVDSTSSGEHIQESPNSVSSNNSPNEPNDDDKDDQILAQFAIEVNGNGGGGGGDGDRLGDIGNGQSIDEPNGKSHGNKRGEFALANPRNIIITPFTGRNSNSNPYMPLNNAYRWKIVLLLPRRVVFAILRRFIH